MGKQAKRKSSGYEHVHTHNPKARESNERKLFNMQSLAIKRFQGYADKIRDNMRNWVPPESIAKSKMGKKPDEIVLQRVRKLNTSMHVMNVQIRPSS
jgi:hypothetical protein